MTIDLTEQTEHDPATPDIRFAISERLTAFERTQMESTGHNPDDFFVLVGVPFEQNMQTAVADGRLMVQGAFSTPMPVINQRHTLLDAAGRAAEANMLAAVTVRMIVRKSVAAIPASDPASVFMACVKAHEGYSAVLASLRSTIPARSEYLSDDTLAFFTLTYQEASMISYRIQRLGLVGVVFVDHTPSIATAASLNQDQGTSRAHDHTLSYLPMWTDADRTALWTAVLQAAPPIDLQRVRGLAESQGVTVPRLASEAPVVPVAMLEDAGGEQTTGVFGELLARLSERMG